MASIVHLTLFKMTMKIKQLAVSESVFNVFLVVVRIFTDYLLKLHRQFASITFPDRAHTKIDQWQIVVR